MAAIKLTLLPIATLVAMSAEEQDKYLIAAHRVGQVAKETTDEFKASFPALGKLYNALQKRLNRAKEAGVVASNTALSSYIESILGKGTKANSHGLSCKDCFSCLVETGMMGEPDYDKCASGWLEKAASICNAVGGDLTHSAVKAAAEILKDRPKTGLKDLQALLDSVKDREPLKPEKVAELLTRIFADGYLDTVITAVGTEIAHLDDAEKGQTAYAGMMVSMSMFSRNMVVTGAKSVDGKMVQETARRFDDATLKGWMDEYKAGLTKKPAPATPTPKPEAAGEVDDEAALQAQPDAETAPAATPELATA